MNITLTGSSDAGQWQVTRDGQAVGTWHRLEHGAALDDLTGERVAVVSNVGDGTAIVAGCGADRGDWSHITHLVLSGQCEIIPGPVPAPVVHEYSEDHDGIYPQLVRARCACGWKTAGYMPAWLASVKYQDHAGEK